MMKKQFVSLLLLVISLFVLSACSGSDTQTPMPTPNPNPNPAPGPNNPPPGPNNPPGGTTPTPTPTPSPNPVPTPTPDPNTPPTTSVITLTFSTPSSEDFKLETVEGSTTVGSVGSLDPEITLEVGKRYKIVNPLGSVHPFALTNSTVWGSSYLLSQSGPGSFAADTEVKYQNNSDGFSFTLTQKLADELKSYICMNHPGMLGLIKVTVP